MKLRTRISLLFIGIALVPIIIISVLTSLLMAKHDEKVQYEHTNEYAIATSRYLETYFTTRRDLIHTYAQLYNEGYNSWDDLHDIVEISVKEKIFEKIILAMKENTEKINTAISSVATLSDTNKELGDELQKTSDGFIL